MKHFFLIICATVAVICVSLVFKLRREVDAISARAVAAENSSIAANLQTEQLEQRSKNLRDQLREARLNALATVSSTQALHDADAANGIRPNNGTLALFRDPEMKHALAAESKSGVARNVRALFDAGLASYLQLNEQQTAKLEQLITQKASIVWEQMLVPMMTGELDEAEMAVRGRELKQALETNKRELLTLLGEQDYAVYEWFDKTQEQRDAFKTLQAGFKKSALTLTANQQEQLLGVMIEERLNFQPRYDPGDPQRLNFERWHENFTEDKINMFFQDKKQFDERVVQRATVVLSPEQSSLLRELLHDQWLRSKFIARSTTALFAQQK